jgi:hypothetical protein
MFLLGALLEKLFKGKGGGGCADGGCGSQSAESNGLNPFGQGGCCGGRSDMSSATARMCQGGDTSCLPQLAFSDE